MQSKRFLVLAILIALAVSCKKKDTETDNLFRFRDFINYTTSGRVSVVDPIIVNLANDVKGWDIDQEIEDNIFSISPHVEGKLINKGKRRLTIYS